MSDNDSFQKVCEIRAAFFRLNDLLGEFVPEDRQTDSASNDVYTVLGAFDWLQESQKQLEQAAREQEGADVNEALKAAQRYKKSYGEIYTSLGEFLDAEDGEGYDVNLDDAWRAFNQAPGLIFWDKIESAINASNTPPPRPQGVPEGWKLVPINSTSDMDIAAHDRGIMGVSRDEAEIIWTVMLDAAPQPPQESNP